MQPHLLLALAAALLTQLGSTSSSSGEDTLVHHRRRGKRVGHYGSHAGPNASVHHETSLGLLRVAPGMMVPAFNPKVFNYTCAQPYTAECVELGALPLPSCAPSTQPPPQPLARKEPSGAGQGGAGVMVLRRALGRNVTVFANATNRSCAVKLGTAGKAAPGLAQQIHLQPGSSRLVHLQVSCGTPANASRYTINITTAEVLPAVPPPLTCRSPLAARPHCGSESHFY